MAPHHDFDPTIQDVGNTTADFEPPITVRVRVRVGVKDMVRRGVSLVRILVSVADE